MTSIVGIVIAGLLLSMGCAATATDSTWTYGAPQENGLHAAKLEHMREIIDGLDPPIDSLVVVRHGVIVFERFPIASPTVRTACTVSTR